MTHRKLTVLALFATACWLGSSCAAGGGSNSCGNGYCEADETSMTCPADCGGSCGNTLCEVGETTAGCPADCYCGNGSCDSGESELTCTLDCLCGDNVCSASESTTSCANDCFCGNGTCDAGESLTTCPAECTSNPVCGNNICETGEDVSCPGDCTANPVCGNNICETGEDVSCPGDCTVACIDSVCDLYPQCGCNAGQMCGLDGNLDRACVAAGSTPAGGICTADTDCAAGTNCLPRNQAATEGLCLLWCEPTTGAGCTGTTSYCNQLVNSSTQVAIPGAAVCTITCLPHNPGASCPTGYGCGIFTHNTTLVDFTDCFGDTGPGTYGDACDVTAGPFCAVGYGCFNDGTSDACYQWCTTGSSCALGACNTAVFDPVLTLGGTTYGLCVI